MAEFSAYKIGDRFLRARRLSAFKRLGSELESRSNAQQRTGKKRLRRHRHSLQTTVKINESRRFRIGSLQLAFDPEFANEREHWLSALKTLRSKLEEEAA